MDDLLSVHRLFHRSLLCRAPQEGKQFDALNAHSKAKSFINLRTFLLSYMIPTPGLR